MLLLFHCLSRLDFGKNNLNNFFKSKNLLIVIFFKHVELQNVRIYLRCRKLILNQWKLFDTI